MLESKALTDTVTRLFTEDTRQRLHLHEVTAAVADRAEVVTADVSGQGLMLISSVWNAALTISLLRSMSRAREDVK